jgi:hypothetical protein
MFLSLRIIALVSCCHYLVDGFAALPVATRAATSLNLYRQVEAAIAQAHQICREDPGCSECKVAWEIVEELEAADSHMQAQANQEGASSSSMDFQTLMASFDILTKQLDGKMDQLIATCDKFEEWGADPSVAELSQLAKQMKVGMTYVKNRLNE